MKSNIKCNKLIILPPATGRENITFLGVHNTIGNLQFPRLLMFFSSKFGIPSITDNMSIIRFDK